MSDILLLLTGAILVNNFVLTQFLGVCPFMGISGRLTSAVAMSAATTFVMTLSSITTWLLYHYLLLPFDLVFLRTISYILVIATVVVGTGMLMQKIDPVIHRVLGIFVPLITTNCVVLGVALLNADRSSTCVESLFHGFGAAAGFSLVLILFSALRERLVIADVPMPFQGAGIALVTAGLMSLAFMGFAGLV